MCQRERCVACGQPDDRPLPSCAHDRLERHEGLPSADEIGGLTPTKPMLAFLGGAIDVDLADTEAAARFLEMVARVIREKRKLRITIE